MSEKAVPPAVNPAITGKDVLITGGGGSIGSELARQVYRLAPRSLTLLDINENSLYLLTQCLSRKGGTPVMPQVISIRDRKALFRLFAQLHPQTVLHAAAHKHVPLMEQNPDQAVKNNIFGTLNLFDAAQAYQAEKVLLISTDKAVRPSSVMGATKRICEQLCLDREGPVFTAVRFGNVVNSAGSVLPLFRQQLREEKKILLTDRRMTRYFLSIPQAAELVLHAAAKNRPGKIYMLDMGQPVSIGQLAMQVIKEEGFAPNEVEIVETGIRPGEKLEELLFSSDERFVPTDIAGLLAADACPEYTVLEKERLLKQLKNAADNGDAPAIRSLLGLQEDNG